MDMEHAVWGTISRVSLEYFTQKMLPPLPEGVDLDDVMKTLKRSGITNKTWRPFARNGHWSGYASKPPEYGERTKKQTFRSFPRIITAIRKAAMLRMKGVEPARKFVLTINDEPDEVEEPFPEDTLPDASIVPCDTDIVTWDSISVAGWHKRYDPQGVVSRMSYNEAGRTLNDEYHHRTRYRCA